MVVMLPAGPEWLEYCSTLYSGCSYLIQGAMALLSARHRKYIRKNPGVSTRWLIKTHEPLSLLPVGQGFSPGLRTLGCGNRSGTGIAWIRAGICLLATPEFSQRFDNLQCYPVRNPRGSRFLQFPASIGMNARLPGCVVFVWFIVRECSRRIL